MVTEAQTERHHLGERGEFTLTHCGLPMAEKDATTNQVGEPGATYRAQHDTVTLRCFHCGAVTTLSQSEPVRKVL